MQLKPSAPAAPIIKVSTLTPSVQKRGTRPAVEPSQPSGVGFVLNGRFHAARNARDVLVRMFGELANRDAMFLERFAALPKHGRTRRYLSRSREELYPGRPDLVRDFSHEVRPGWWLGVNLSRNAIERILEMASEVAGLRWNLDVNVNLGA